MSKGCAYLVGAGPGDPGLITVRGLELLSQADVVIYDYLASPRLLAHVRTDAEIVYVGKQAGHHALDQSAINALLVDRVTAGRTVVRLKGGDPFVFGRGGEEALALREAGVAFEVVPGVTAAVASAAYAGIPVTHRGLASSVALITGHEAPDKDESALDWSVLGRWRGTLAFYMGLANLAPLCSRLIAHGLPAETPAALIRWGTTARQRVVVGTVGDLPDRAAEAQLQPPVIILIGPVVALRQQLDWLERRPLFGQRIVVTRAAEQASALAARLEQIGAEVIEAPVIRIVPPDDPGPLRQAVADLARFDWIIWTSVNGVEAFFGALTGAGRDARSLGRCRLCVVGPATADRLARFGLRADVVPARSMSAAIVEALSAVQNLAGVRLLCPRADIASPQLVEQLRQRGAEVADVVAYRTMPDAGSAAPVRELLEADQIDWITFTSASTVRNFLDAVAPRWPDPCRARLAAIGPETSAALRRADLSPAVQADPHTLDGLVQAILDSPRDPTE